MQFRSGRMVILAMFGFSIAAALFGLWYRWSVTRRTIELWTGPTAALVLQAPDIEALRFEPPLTLTQQPQGDVLNGQAAEKVAVARVRGIINIRQAFIEDSTFVWQKAVDPQTLRWTYGLQFVDHDNSCVVLFDPTTQAIGNPATGRAVAIEPQASDELDAFFDEQFSGKPQRQAAATD